MDNARVIHYFLGSNSRNGFYSLYSELTNPEDGEFLWVIKGGPGCGKSSFMRSLGKAAEEAGLPVEYVHCSGDPHSLDAVRFPSLKTAYVDGTSPHVIEAVYPGCASLYLDLGTFYDAGALEGSLGEIVRLNREYKALYERAYAFLSAAGSISPTKLFPLCSQKARDKIRKKVAGVLSREMKALDKKGSVRSIFLDAISCEGIVSYSETIPALCSKVCVLDNGFGLAGFYLDEICAAAIARGYDAIVCCDPLSPEEKRAVCFPELSLGFLSLDKGETYTGEVYRHIRLDALVDRESSTAYRHEFRQCRKIYDMLVSCAVSSLAQAKALHDELEAIYNPHVDFDALYQVAEDHKTWLLGK